MQSHPASFRDNDGFIFNQDGVLYRYVAPGYELHYRKLMDSGLYAGLVKKKKLVAHIEAEDKAKFGFTEGLVLVPDQISMISYPYEWSFDMWKDAALLTLQIGRQALQKEMILKDATPFNIQFVNANPIFIDTLSFENYTEGEPWVAYRQFCECFLAPLLLMHYCHPGLGKLFTVYPNGMPMDVLASLLPGRSKWNLNTQLHVHLQARFAKSGKQKQRSAHKFSRQKMDMLLKGLESFVHQLKIKKVKTTWDDYYSGTILGDDYLNAKTALVQSFTAGIEYQTVVDLGANDGYFSLLVGKGKQVVATDADPNCINELYLNARNKNAGILPLINDIATPTPAIGWNNTEREALGTRLKADLVMALALVHHVAIAGNVPLKLVAEWLAPIGTYLLIEFVPKEDEKVKLLLQNREDIFKDYNLHTFKEVFTPYYQVLKEEQVGNTNRVLFLLKRKI